MILIHSNDPNARALTLRDFANNLCPILCTLLRDSTTTIDTKLDLIRLAGHLHHDANMLTQTRTCLVECIKAYPTCEMVVCTLRTLTGLTTKAPIHANDQIDLLLDSFTTDTRSFVRLQSLTCIADLAHLIPHQFHSRHLVVSLMREDQSSSTTNVYQFNSPIDCVRHVLLQFPTSRLTLKAIQLGCQLTCCDQAFSTISKDDDDLFSHEFVSTLVAHFSASAANNRLLDLISEVPREVEHAFKLIIKFLTTFPNHADIIFDMNLFNQIRLDSGPSVGLLSQFLISLLTNLPHALISPPNHRFTHVDLIEQLISSSGQRRSSDDEQSPTLVDTPDKESATRDTDNTAVSVCGLVFELATINHHLLTVEQSRCLLQAVADSDQALSPWLAYQIARQANRYGQHRMAASLYQKLTSTKISERVRYWMLGLEQFSEFQATIINNLADLDAKGPADSTDPPILPTSDKATPWVTKLLRALKDASQCAFRTSTTFICVGGGQQATWFQTTYLNLLANLYTCLDSLCTSVYHRAKLVAVMRKRLAGLRDPPRYIVNPDDTSSTSIPVPVWIEQELDRWYQLANQLIELRARCFDADQRTLDHLDAIRGAINFFIGILMSFGGSLIPRLKNSLPTTSIHSTLDNNSPNSTEPWYDVVRHLKQMVTDNRSTNGDSFAFIWMPYLILRLVRTPLQCPRFFFQRLRSTNVRLLIVPKGSAPTHPASTTASSSSLTTVPTTSSIGTDALSPTTIFSGVNHLVQVMGVVQLGQGRSISRFEIELSVFPVESNAAATSSSPPLPVYTDRQSIAQLQRDFFQLQFCINYQSLASGADHQPSRLYRLRASVDAIDQLGNRWVLVASSNKENQNDDDTLIRVESPKPVKVVVQFQHQHQSSSVPRPQPLDCQPVPVTIATSDTQGPPSSTPIARPVANHKQPPALIQPKPHKQVGRGGRHHHRSSEPAAVVRGRQLAATSRHFSR